MRSLLLALLTLISCPISKAYGGELIQLDQLMLSTKFYTAGGTNYLITHNGLLGRTQGEGFSINVDMTLVDWFYCDLVIHADTDRIRNPDGSISPGQFRAVGLENSLGMDFRKLDLGIPVRVGYYHYSQHVLDYQPAEHHPVEDALEIQVFFYMKGKY